MTTTERTKWLKERQSGVGATDICSIAGVGFQSAADVYAEKIAPEPIDRPALPIMRMGLALEQHNAALYAERFLADGDFMSCAGLQRAEGIDFAFATIDRIAIHEERSRCVELKYVRWFNERWGDDGSDIVPDAYSIQATWQQGILLSQRRTDLLAPHISALDSSGEQRVFNVVYNARLFDLLVELAAEFWWQVENRELVGPDWNHPLRQKIATLLPIRPNTTIDLGSELIPLADEFERLTAIHKEGEAAKKQRDSIRDTFFKLLGESEKGKLPDGRIVRQTHVLRKAYQVKDSEYRVLKLLPVGAVAEDISDLDPATILPRKTHPKGT